MKVLIFTHRSDIDGMGGVVLAKLAFDEVDYVLCEGFELQESMEKYFDDGAIYEYDRVFVTDLWLEGPMLSKVAQDKWLEGKFFLFDHHESALEMGSDKYPFSTIRIADEKGLCCGTSLFYNYLVECNLIDVQNQAIEDFSELTRRYDTWEWRTRYYDELPHLLTLLFDSVGSENYIQLMVKKLSGKSSSHFELDDMEKMIINSRVQLVRKKIVRYSQKLFYRQIFGLKAGIAFIEYEYRNDLAEYLRQQGFDIDFVMLVAVEHGTISYRSIKDGVNVRLIAEKMGGRGHDVAASSPIPNLTLDKILDVLTSGRKK